MSKQPTNGELAIMLKNVLEKVESIHDLRKEENLLKRVSQLEFWRGIVVWGAGVFVSASLLVGTTVYGMAIDKAVEITIATIERREDFIFNKTLINK